MTALDTLSATRRLEAAGFERDKAEAVAETVNGLANGELATKADLAELKASAKVDLYRGLLGVVAANAAITFGLLKLLLP